MNAKIQKLADAIHAVGVDLAFTIMEIGARPLGGQTESFHQLTELFPGSRILAFELEEQLCDELNAQNSQNIRYFSVALGCAEEQRLLFETVHPMCSSLYKPCDDLLGLYNNLEVAMLKKVSTIQTVSLDSFLNSRSIEDVDFIKIDIQGAELDVFRGGSLALQKIIAIVSEVEFIPLYYKQPLFGDVCSFLAEQGFMFHKFLGMAGRSLQPTVINSNANFATQHMWSDAMFIKHVTGLDKLPSDKLLKLGLLAFMYGSPDVACHCFTMFDHRQGTALHRTVLDV